MQLQPTIIERAFELAGQCGSIEEVRHRLKGEGFFQVDAHLSGPKIRSELALLLDRALAGERGTRNTGRRKSGSARGR